MAVWGVVSGSLSFRFFFDVVAPRHHWEKKINNTKTGAAGEILFFGRCICKMVKVVDVVGGVLVAKLVFVDEILFDKSRCYLNERLLYSGGRRSTDSLPSSSIT